MANRVKDILIDVGSGDLLFSRKTGRSVSYYDVVNWELVYDNNGPAYYYADVYVPLGRVGQLSAVDGRFLLYFHASYKPAALPFWIRIVTKDDDGMYVPVKPVDCAFPVVSRVDGINASELLYISLDGYYVANLSFVNDGADVAHVYSAGNVDFCVGISDEQSAQFLSLCGAGKYYRFPLSGVDVTKYVNSVVGHSDLSERISEEFGNDGINAQDIGFDSSTGKIDVQFKHEESIAERAVLVDTVNLDYDAIDVTDLDLNEAALRVDFKELDTDYDLLDTGTELPYKRLKSCFANGVWISEYPWTDAYYWKDFE